VTSAESDSESALLLSRSWLTCVRIATVDRVGSESPPGGLVRLVKRLSQSHQTATACCAETMPCWACYFLAHATGVKTYQLQQAIICDSQAFLVIYTVNIIRQRKVELSRRCMHTYDQGPLPATIDYGAAAVQDTPPCALFNTLLS
jgi:hypothetical protein